MKIFFASIALVPILLLAVSCRALPNSEIFPTVGHQPTQVSSGPYPAPYTNYPAPKDGVPYFTVAPIDFSQSIRITALGHIGGGGHVEPTAHAGIYAPTSSTVQNIYAMTNGTVIGLYQDNNNQWKITFRATSNLYYYLSPVVTSNPPAAGSEVHAGDLLGTTPAGGSLDVGAFDASVTLTGFVNPARYSYDEQHCVTPWEYLTQPIKSQIYAKIYRKPGATSDARIDQDVPGTLAGTWFEESLPADAEIVEGPLGWPKTVSFALDEYDGATPRFSLGGWINTLNPPGNPPLQSGGCWAVPSSVGSWASITPSSGLQEMPLTIIIGGLQVGWLAVQMLSDSEIEIEIWAGDKTSSMPFDSGALYYFR